MTPNYWGKYRTINQFFNPLTMIPMTMSEPNLFNNNTIFLTELFPKNTVKRVYDTGFFCLTANYQMIQIIPLAKLLLINLDSIVIQN